jgi:GNAT superfamily N-acetyltransferase
MFVSLLHDTICGHVYVRWTGFRTHTFVTTFPDTPVFNSLAVWPDALRNNGIGTALVHTVVVETASRGFDRIGLGIYAENEAAIRFYERIGFKSWGQSPIADVNERMDPGVIAMTKHL